MIQGIQAIPDTKVACERLSVRSHVYGFLRRVFASEVDVSVLAWLRASGRDGLWEALSIDLSDVLQSADDPQVLEDLAVDFCRLFILSGSHGSPHESVHLGSQNGKGGSSLLWGDSAAAVLDLYRQAGFEVDVGSKRIPDALDVELEFMERLCNAEQQAHVVSDLTEAQRLRTLQNRMRKEHLNRWVPAYVKQLKPMANTKFYVAMLELLAGFLALEED